MILSCTEIFQTRGIPLVIDRNIKISCIHKYIVLEAKHDYVFCADPSRFRLTHETSFVKAHTSYWTRIPFFFYVVSSSTKFLILQKAYFELHQIFCLPFIHNFLYLRIINWIKAPCTLY